MAILLEYDMGDSLKVKRVRDKTITQYVWIKRKASSTK